MFVSLGWEWKFVRVSLALFLHPFLPPHPSPFLQGFFGPRVPVDNLDAGVIGVNYFSDKDLVNPVIISPDAGGVYRAKKFLEGCVWTRGLLCGASMRVCVVCMLCVWVFVCTCHVSVAL